MPLNNKNLYVVIMAGGKGERFWPESRLKTPKHLLPIFGDTTLIVQTINRLEGLVPKENIFVITNQAQEAATRKTCVQLTADQIIAEPIGRDTAPAVGLAKSLVKLKNPNAIFAILPADHIIHDFKNFQISLKLAFEAANQEPVLVTLGIKPTFPATGYGYIQKGFSWNNIKKGNIFKVKKFVEKPSSEIAEQYVSSGDYFWNAGMFIWSVPTLESALEKHCPKLHASLLFLEEQLSKKALLPQVLENLYPTLEKISIDFALMEKADNIITVVSSFDWDDAGEWTATERHLSTDSLKNIVRGLAIIQSGKNNIVFNQNGHLTALVGVDDLIVVNTPDATLVCHKSKAQDIKKLVKAIGENPNLKHLI